MVPNWQEASPRATDLNWASWHRHLRVVYSTDNVRGSDHRKRALQARAQASPAVAVARPSAVPLAHSCNAGARKVREGITAKGPTCFEKPYGLDQCKLAVWHEKDVARMGISVERAITEDLTAELTNEQLHPPARLVAETPE